MSSRSSLVNLAIFGPGRIRCGSKEPEGQIAYKNLCAIKLTAQRRRERFSALYLLNNLTARNIA
jgi:hypothetical protein